MTPIRLPLLIALLGASLLGCDSNGARSAAKPAIADADLPQRCAALTGKEIGFGTVTEVAHVNQGDELVPMAKRMMLKVVLPFELPPLPAPRNFCRVWADLKPVPGSLIKVQAWLPDDWNGKMLAKGGGGFNGGLFGASLVMREGSAKGYAMVVTDVGHDMSDSAKFAYDNKEAFIDYGYRGNHATAVYTKDLIEAYYGKPPRLAYFEGGSNGGREALMEARRFPEDYDGIIAGMPAMSFTQLMASFLWNYEAAISAPGLKNKLSLVQETVLNKCDASDGVPDRVLENPMLCAFDPVELQCKSGDTANCLNAGEVTALRKIYGGPRMADGKQLYPGLPVGGEALPENWDTWILNEKAIQRGMGEEFFRWMVFGDPKWDKSQFDLDRDYPVAQKRAAPILDADDPDLSEYLRSGRKLIIHHGWNDAAVPAASTLNYYEAVLNKAGHAGEQQVRLFMVPGMKHGAGRPGPDHYDMLSELDRWVEGGPAPERIIGRQHEPAATMFGIDPAAKVVRTRPLCAWPKTAHYTGSGSTEDAASFSCK
jgi:hypothetical protein